MKIKVICQTGTKFSDEIDYAVIQNNQGQMAIMNNHIPMITYVNKKGYIKLVSGTVTSYLVMSRGSVVYKENSLNVYALFVQIGKTLEEAIQAFDRAHKEESELSKKENIDYSKQERELREHIMNARAGHL